MKKLLKLLNPLTFVKLSYRSIFLVDDLATSALIVGGISAAASIGTAIYNHFQVKKANDAASGQFDQMMDFQRNSYKYTAEDMNNAGLNPALLATGAASPSSAPSGSTFQSAQASGIGDMIGSLGSAAIQAKNQKDIATGTNETQKDVAVKQGDTAKEVAAMNNSTQLALHTKDEDLKKAQIELLNKQAENAAAATREQKRSTDYWENAGADPSSAPEYKLTKEAAAALAGAIKKGSKPSNASNATALIDKYSNLGHDKFVKFYPTYQAFCRAVALDTGANQKDLIRDRSLMNWYKHLKGAE